MSVEAKELGEKLAELGIYQATLKMKGVEKRKVAGGKMNKALKISQDHMTSTIEFAHKKAKIAQYAKEEEVGNYGYRNHVDQIFE